MMKITLYIQKNYIVYEKYLKMIENLKSKSLILVKYFDNKTELNTIYTDDNYKQYIICDPIINISESYNNFISVLKDILWYLLKKVILN